MFRHTVLLRGAAGASVEQLEDLVDIARRMRALLPASSSSCGPAAAPVRRSSWRCSTPSAKHDAQRSHPAGRLRQDGGRHAARLARPAACRADRSWRSSRTPGVRSTGWRCGIAPTPPACRPISCRASSCWRSSRRSWPRCCRPVAASSGRERCSCRSPPAGPSPISNTTNEVQGIGDGLAGGDRQDTASRGPTRCSEPPAGPSEAIICGLTRHVYRGREAAPASRAGWKKSASDGGTWPAIVRPAPQALLGPSTTWVSAGLRPTVEPARQHGAAHLAAAQPAAAVPRDRASKTLLQIRRGPAGYRPDLGDGGYQASPTVSSSAASIA